MAPQNQNRGDAASSALEEVVYDFGDGSPEVRVPLENQKAEPVQHEYKMEGIPSGEKRKVTVFARVEVAPLGYVGKPFPIEVVLTAP